MKVVMTPMPGGVGPGEPDDVVMRDLQATFPDVDFVWCETEEDQLIAIADAEAYCGWPTRKVFLAAKNLKWIHCAGTGIDGIMKIPELVESDIPVTNSRDSHVSPMATHVFALITSLAQRLPSMWTQQRAREWRPEDYGWRQIELESSTLGIYGFGNIGRTLAGLALPLGFTVVASDPFVSAEDAAAAGVTLLPLEELLGQADVVSLHATLTADTEGLIDADALARMKRGALLLNLGRGGLIDGLDILHHALDEGRLGAVALDTFEPEPPDLGHPIFRHERCICSPHVLGLTPGAMHRIYVSMATDMAAVLAGNRPRYCVNPETLAGATSRSNHET